MNSEKKTITVTIAGSIPFLRSLLRIAIEDTGFIVIGEASDGPELLAFCIHTHPDIILIDLNVPESDITKVIESILDIEPDVSIITISDVTENFAEVMLSVGARAHIQKPFSMEDLIDVMKKVTPILKLS